MSEEFIQKSNIEIDNVSLFDALIPVFVLILFLSLLSVYVFGSDTSSGPNQITLTLTTFIAGIIGYKNGYTWSDIQKGMINGITMAMGAILILLAVGMLIGTWILSGTVPTLLVLCH